MSDPRYWGFLPEEKMASFLRMAEREGCRAAVEKYTDGYIQEYALDERRADFKALLPLTSESVVLDLGSGWGPVAISLARSCREVVGTDIALDNLRFIAIRARQEGIENISLVQIDLLDEGNLPFSDASFDIVLLNGVLEWVGDIAQGPSPTECQLACLREVKRVLRPGGALYIGIENRFGYPLLLGAPDGHSKLRFGTVLPRLLASLYSRLVRGKDYRTYTYSYDGYRSLLKKGGFEEVSIFWPIPSYREPRFIVPLEDGRLAEFFFRRILPTYPLSWKRRLAAKLAGPLFRLGIGKYLVSSYSIVAFAKPAGQIRNRLPLSAIKLSGRAGRSGITSLLLFSERASEPAYFLKIAWGKPWGERLAEEFRTLSAIQAALAGTGLEGSIPRPLALLSAGGQTFLLETALRGEALVSHIKDLPAGALKDHRARFERCLGWLASFHRRMAVEEVAFDPAIVSERLSRYLRLIDPGFPWGRQIGLLAEELRGEPLPLTLRHGDFSPQNILVNGHALGVSDWEEARRSPFPLTDAVNFITGYSLSLHRCGDDLGERFRALLLTPGPYLDLVQESLKTYLREMGVASRFLDLAFPSFFMRAALDAHSQGARPGYFPPWPALLEMYMASYSREGGRWLR